MAFSSSTARGSSDIDDEGSEHESLYAQSIDSESIASDRNINSTNKPWQWMWMHSAQVKQHHIDTSKRTHEDEQTLEWEPYVEYDSKYNR